MSDSDADLIRLLRGLLIPFDIDAVSGYLETIKQDADSTSWSPLFRRIANIGLLLGSIGIFTFVIVYFLNDSSFNIPIPKFGLGYIVAIAVFALMIIAKFLIQLARGINAGKSPLAFNEEYGQAVIALEFLVGIFFTVGTIYTLSDIGNILTLFSFMVGATGLLLTGLGLTLSSLTLIYAYYIRGDTREGENATLDEFTLEDLKD